LDPRPAGRRATNQRHEAAKENNMKMHQLETALCTMTRASNPEEALWRLFLDEDSSREEREKVELRRSQASAAACWKAGYKLADFCLEMEAYRPSYHEILTEAAYRHLRRQIEERLRQAAASVEGPAVLAALAGFFGIDLEY
jgi:hypothetical protein